MHGIFRTLIDQALERVDPRRLIRDQLTVEGHFLRIRGQTVDLNSIEQIHLIGAGKAAPFFREGLTDVLGDRIRGGIIVSLADHVFEDHRIRFVPGAHPTPDARSLRAGQAVTDYIRTRVGSNDLVFFAISGGASAMMAQPLPGLTLADKTEINRLLLASGAEVTETNCVRKHLSALKGGKLARLIHPARVITLILSDIVDSPLDVGSSPTVINPHTRSSKAEARAILEKYHLLEQCHPRVQRFFEKTDSDPETDLPEESGAASSFSVVLGENRVAVEAAAECARAQGITTHILTTRDRGDVTEAARLYAAIVKEVIDSGNPFKPPVLLLSGGELTVKIENRGTPPGKGGRNQALVLAMLMEMANISHPFAIASVGTDGIDGSSDAAGAWIDHRTAEKARRQGLDPVDFFSRYDSHAFFQTLDQQVKTGPTRTNVMDLRLFYIPTGDSRG
ncbi:MAG: glycerate kinase type-2 family protein [Candidatus Omnitrophota bacterium]